MKNYIKSGCCLAMMILFIIPPFLHGQVPVAVNDTVDLTPGFPVTVDLLANDTVAPGDSIRIIFTTPFNSIVKTTLNGDKTYTFLLEHWGFGGITERGYKIMDYTSDTSSQTGLVVFRVHDHSKSSLDVNNVRALFNASGLHFFRDSAEYEVPKGSGKMSIFANSVWIGGMDPGSTLHFAGEQYRQGSSSIAGTKHDYWAGPVSDSSGYNSAQDTIWNRIWKINKPEIDYHRAHFWEAGYMASRDILTWPAHGDTSLGQSAQLAPFSDRNANGKYEPYDGDYPEIRGDQALFFIYNDDHGYHSESTGDKLKVEIHGMAYAFYRPKDTAFKNTTFLHLKFYNRSNYAYSDSWIGVFTDIDLGYANDDYLGCDPERGMYYGYNGTPVDGTGQTYAYGENPPVQAVVFLGGPLMDPDGYDNPSFRGSSLNGPSFKGNCDIVAQNGMLQTMKYGPGEIYEGSFLVRSEAINGLQFGDGIADNERLGMRRFFNINNSSAGIPTYGQNYPLYASEYYEVMNGLMKDGSKMIYGGNGHPMLGGYSPECDYMFPGLTDTCDWGTAGLLPNGPKEWTERTAKNNPHDRRGAGSTGPFTFLPGTTQELDLAFVWARCYNPSDSNCAMQKINAVVDTIRHAFSTNRLPGGGVIYGMNESRKADNRFVLYPNPNSGVFRITTENDFQGPLVITVFDLAGKVAGRKQAEGEHDFTVDFSELHPGCYLVVLNTEDGLCAKQLLLIR